MSVCMYSASLKAIVRMRKTPPVNIPEHYANAADWALPTLFSWLPAEVSNCMYCGLNLLV